MIKKEITYGEKPYIAYDDIMAMNLATNPYIGALLTTIHYCIGKLGFQATMKKK